MRMTVEEDLVRPFEIAVRVRKFETEDLKALEDGLNWAAVGRLKQAIGEFERYVRVYSERNPICNISPLNW